MKKDCSTCLCREGSCYPSITIFDKDKTCRSYTPDYEGYIAELEKENNELKTVKIPQLERKIASIRGAHSVDCRKLNARTEQVERLKKVNAELEEQIEKMKSHSNCKHRSEYNEFDPYNKVCQSCCNLEKWEFGL